MDTHIKKYGRFVLFLLNSLTNAFLNNAPEIHIDTENHTEKKVNTANEQENAVEHLENNISLLYN